MTFQNYDVLTLADHETAFVFTPNRGNEEAATRPVKRRKKSSTSQISLANHPERPALQYEKLLDGKEGENAAKLRQELFTRSWSSTEAKIQTVLDEANEGTIKEIISFIQGKAGLKEPLALPTGFIVTGPNISSQELLFSQLSNRLKQQVDGPSVLLRSGDAPNLKNALKQIIRACTEQKLDLALAEGDSKDSFGRKSMTYDLEILHRYVQLHQSSHVVIAFQDSEAFNTELLSDLIQLLRSWLDRIPFIILYGIATSVDFFYDRLPRSASRCLSGPHFDVEKTPAILERIFRKTVANVNAPLVMGGAFVSSLMARQKDHVQSVQSFTAALKYAHMCHYYGNALSVLREGFSDDVARNPEHLDAVRILPSFRDFVENSLETGQSSQSQMLLENDQALLDAMKSKLKDGKRASLAILRAIYLLENLSPEPVELADLYINAVEGRLEASNMASRLLDTLKRMNAEDLIQFISSMRSTIETGCADMDLEGWGEECTETMQHLSVAMEQLARLIKESKENGLPLQSSYAIHNKGLRTTIIAQRVQLSYEKSSMSEQDQAFTSIVDKLSTTVRDSLMCLKPTHIFLHEVWFYDSTFPTQDVFTPRPRHAVEHALNMPHNYLHCACCTVNEDLSAAQPTTAILYQMCLQAGSLVNISDLWTTFCDNQQQIEEEGFNEREALADFYKGLVELKLLGLIKQSKKKIDHLAKISWMGL